MLTIQQNVPFLNLGLPAKKFNALQVQCKTDPSHSADHVAAFFSFDSLLCRERDSRYPVPVFSLIIRCSRSSPGTSTGWNSWYFCYNYQSQSALFKHTICPVMDRTRPVSRVIDSKHKELKRTLKWFAGLGPGDLWKEKCFLKQYIKISSFI